MVQFEGKYKLTKSDGFEEYMKAIGVGFAKRKIANNTTPTLKVTKDGDKFSIETITTLKTYVTSFTLGVKSDDTSLDDLPVKSLVTLEGDNVLKQIQERPDGETEILREFTDTEMKCTFKIGDVVATRIYTRQPE